MIGAGPAAVKAGEGVTSAVRTTWKGRMKEPVRRTRAWKAPVGARGSVSASESAVGDVAVGVYSAKGLGLQIRTVAPRRRQ